MPTFIRFTDLYFIKSFGDDPGSLVPLIGVPLFD